LKKFHCVTSWSHAKLQPRTKNITLNWHRQLLLMNYCYYHELHDNQSASINESSTQWGANCNLKYSSLLHETQNEPPWWNELCETKLILNHQKATIEVLLSSNHTSYWKKLDGIKKIVTPRQVFKQQNSDKLNDWIWFLHTEQSPLEEML
jgi:hypothetical protein